MSKMFRDAIGMFLECCFGCPSCAERRHGDRSNAVGVFGFAHACGSSTADPIGVVGVNVVCHLDLDHLRHGGFLAEVF